MSEKKIREMGFPHGQVVKGQGIVKVWRARVWKRWNWKKVIPVYIDILSCHPFSWKTAY